MPSARHLWASFLAKHFGGVVGHDMYRPIGTVTARDHHALAAASLVKFRGTSQGHMGQPDIEEPPRMIGAGETSLRGTPLQRATQSYSLWMLQRTLDAYRALGDEPRGEVSEAFAGTGWEEVLAYEPRHRLGKRRFRLVFE